MSGARVLFLSQHVSYRVKTGVAKVRARRLIRIGGQGSETIGIAATIGCKGSSG